MNLTVIRTKDWVSIVDPVLGIGGAGKDYVDAFAAFGRSMHHTTDEWDEQFENDVRSGRLDGISRKAIDEVRSPKDKLSWVKGLVKDLEENRAVIVEQESSRIHPAPDSNTDHDFEGKPRVGRPRAKNSLSSAQRKKLWKKRHGEDALKKEREYQRDYRKRRKATKRYHLKEEK